MKRIAFVLSVTLLAMGLIACNTMKGMGQDIESGGQKMENAAEKSK